MTWKIAIESDGNIIYWGKRYIKKHFPRSSKITKYSHDSDDCSGDIYFLGTQKVPGFDQPREIWVCMETGKVLLEKPKLKVRKPKVKKSVKPAKEKKKVKTSPIKTTGSSIAPSKDTITLDKVKGIGTKALEQLQAVNITNVDALLSKDSKEIAKLLGRKSDTQIKKWQENARSLL